MELVGYLGTMNSAKSAMALMKAHKYQEDKESLLVFKPAQDTRDGMWLKSRALVKPLAANVVQETDKGWMYILAQTQKHDHVIVDEVQFFSPIFVDELAVIAHELGIKVECYGLKVDFRSKLFPGSKRLIELADRIVTIENDCTTPGCRMPATQNMRLQDGEPVFDGEVVMVGKEDKYRAVCTSCYLKACKERGNTNGN